MEGLFNTLGKTLSYFVLLLITLSLEDRNTMRRRAAHGWVCRWVDSLHPPAAASPWQASRAPQLRTEPKNKCLSLHFFLWLTSNRRRLSTSQKAPLFLFYAHENHLRTLGCRGLNADDVIPSPGPTSRASVVYSVPHSCRLRILCIFFLRNSCPSWVFFKCQRGPMQKFL